MKWDYWICLYIRTHCTARGLRSTTIEAYARTLQQFRAYVQVRLEDLEPDRIVARHVLEYVEYLRSERNNGGSAINRTVTVLRNFYRAMVCMGHLEVADNPLAHFPKIKATPRKLPSALTAEQVGQLLAAPPDDTILGLRDRAILTLLYGTGIRATECAQATLDDVDLNDGSIRVVGKGGHERVIPLNDKVVESLQVYLQARGRIDPGSALFLSRMNRPMSRGAIYERVRTAARRAGLAKRVSPHRLRHTFATHLVMAGENLVTIRDLLGHRLITSTQVYLHVTARDMREAADRHPIQRLAPTVQHLLPDVKLPMQRPRFRSGTG